MSAAEVVSRLERVRKTGGDSWTACCPAHDDRGPSLSIRELASGHVLVHCFAGCQAHDILDALGLEYGVLFPPRENDAAFIKPRHPFSASDALRALAFEANLIAVAGADLHRGIPLSDADYERLLLAVGRIAQAAHLARVLQ